MPEKKPQEPERSDFSLKQEIVDTVKDDVIGVRDWRRSKVAFLTGLSNLYRAFGSVISMLGGSAHRLSYMYKYAFKRENVPELEIKIDDDKKRFESAMRFYQVDSAKYNAILLNTYRSFYLYSFVAILGFSWFLFSNLYWPPISIASGLLRLGATPLAVAFSIKNAYTNYIMRCGSLVSFGHFIKSMKYLPMKKAVF